MVLEFAEQALLTGALALPALASLYRSRLFPRLRTRWLFLACCVVVYAMVLARVQLVDMRFEQELLAYDLDRDGGFSEVEQTAAQRAAMARFSNDTGRGLAPLTAAIAAPATVGLAFGIVALVTRTRRFVTRRLPPWA